MILSYFMERYKHVCYLWNEESKDPYNKFEICSDDVFLDLSRDSKYYASPIDEFGKAVVIAPKVDIDKDPIYKNGMSVYAYCYEIAYIQFEYPDLFHALPHSYFVEKEDYTND